MKHVLCSGSLITLIALSACSLPHQKSPPSQTPTSVDTSTLSLERLPFEKWPLFRDNGHSKSLETLIKRGQKYFDSLPPDQKFVFGADVFRADHLSRSLRVFYNLWQTSPADLRDRLRSSFWVYRSIGKDGLGAVKFSGYYEHTFKASFVQTEKYRYPLYRLPPDLIEVDYASFDAKKAGERLSGRLKGQKLVPYHTRYDIESRQILKKQKLEIAWAEDPLDVYFLHIQGSGWIQPAAGGDLVRIRYAGNNGHRYRSVGLHMIKQGLVSKDNFGRQVLVDYMEQHPAQIKSLLNHNPRYIFFELDRSARAADTLGSLRVPLTAYRSVALDPVIFPRGALAWVETSGAKRLQRFVLNQDEGAAIKGPGRVDFFVGAGDKAEEFAVGLWEMGQLYFLVLRPDADL